MKDFILSKYNFCKEKEDGIVILNLYTKYVFAIEKEEYKQLIRYKNCLSQLKTDIPNLFNLMLKLGVIQEASINIPNRRLVHNRLAVFSGHTYKLTINTTLNCNFSCWYCYQAHPKGKMSAITLNSILKFITNLIEKEKISNLEISWFGGEPLMAFEAVIKPIGKFIKEICLENNVNYISNITTNGSLIRENMIPLFQEVKINLFQITLDGNREAHNTTRFNTNNRGSYDIIVYNICLLLNNMSDVKILLRINYTKENLDKCKDIIDSFPENLRTRISVLLVQVWQDSSKNHISDSSLTEVLSLFRKAGFRVNNKYTLNNRTYTCYADIYNQAVINYDGRVFKCTQGDFENDKEDGILLENGTIVWNEDARSKRVSRATFDNTACLNCEVLPSCTGPCSERADYSKIAKETCSLKKSYLAEIDKMLDIFELIDSDLSNIYELEKII